MPVPRFVRVRVLVRRWVLSSTSEEPTGTLYQLMRNRVDVIGRLLP